MHILAFHITANVPFKPDLDLTDHDQAKPLKIETALLFSETGRVGGAEWLVRPEGYEIPSASSFGNVWQSGLSLRNILAAITAQGGACGNAEALLCHNFEEQNNLMRICRKWAGLKDAQWFTPPKKPIDTAQMSLIPLNQNASGKLDMSAPIKPTLKEATKAILGQEIGGLRGVLDLYEKLKEKEAA